jgi:2-hydroxychromene-2-carboxylate isomerase
MPGEMLYDAPLLTVSDEYCRKSSCTGSHGHVLLQDSMKRGSWYFDFVSLFAYLHAKQLGSLVEILEPKPVLFAAILNHWGQKGPAELASKRLYTYRRLHWVAKDRDIMFRMPATHPFNPLPYLRLAISQHCVPRIIERIFDELYTTAADPASPKLWAELCRSIGVDDGTEASAQLWVKELLRRNTEEAIAAGVFGVPTVIIDGNLFWGEDSLPMLRAYLKEPALFESEEMRRISNIAPSAERRD